MKQEIVKSVVVTPGKLPVVKEIENKLEVLQGTVGGWIEVLPLEEGICLICNEEGKLDQLPLNRGLRNEEGELWEIIAGTFIVVGEDINEGDFISLTDEQAEYIKEKFYYPEMFYNIGGQIVAQKLPIDQLFN